MKREYYDTNTEKAEDYGYKRVTIKAYNISSEADARLTEGIICKRCQRDENCFYNMETEDLELAETILADESVEYEVVELKDENPGELKTVLPGFGTLIASNSYDVGYPEMSILFRPWNSDDLIDICCAKGVTEDSKMFNENVGDVSVYVWGDPSNDDFTDKVIIKQKEIQEAIS